MASLGGDPEGWVAERQVDWWGWFWNIAGLACLIGLPLIFGLGLAGVI